MPQKPEASQWWLDDNLWLDLLKPILLNDPNRAGHAAKLFRRLLVENENGPEGVARVSLCLQNGIRLTQRFARIYNSLELPPDKSSIAILSEMTAQRARPTCLVWRAAP